MARRRGNEAPERRASAERQPAVVARSSIRRWMWGWGLVAGLAILGALIWINWWRQSEARARVPPPPSVEHSAAVAEHLRIRYTATQRDPTSIETIGPLCLAYHADMFYDHAERCYALAATLAPDDWRWTYDRAVIHSERGGGSALLVGLRQVVGRAPQFGPAWLRLGEAEFKAGRYDEAVEAWRKARDLPAVGEGSASPRHVIEVPLSAYASLGLARIALVREEFDAAGEILEEVSVATPHFGPALRLLADSYRRLGREDEAARLVYRAGRLPPYTPYADPLIDELARESRNSTFLLRLASEANLSINAEWSEFLTRRALEFDPDNPDVVLKLGRILRTVGRSEEALELFHRYHELVPGDYQGLAHIGGCLSALGRYDEAESYLRRAQTGLDDPVTHYNLGLLLALTGRIDQAVREYEKALERDPMHSDARSNLAAALARQGRLDRASRELERLVGDDPENAVARANLGLVLLQRGQAARARVQLQEAVRLDPQLIQASEALESLNQP